jgi:RNA polymerase sigma-70 factor (ECF subfamily)
LTVNTSYNHLSDEALLAAYHADGNKEWLGYLLQRYTALLFGVAMKYLKDKMQAEDAVQQVFLKVLTHLPEEKMLNFKGWLYILMRNHSLQQLRNKNHLADEASIINVAAAEPDIESVSTHERSLDEMGTALAMLSEEQRKTIEMFYLKKCSYDEIIAQTGYTFMQVKSYIQNGKRNLRTILLKKSVNRG